MTSTATWVSPWYHLSIGTVSPRYHVLGSTEASLWDVGMRTRGFEFIHFLLEAWCSCVLRVSTWPGWYKEWEGSSILDESGGSKKSTGFSSGVQRTLDAQNRSDLTWIKISVWSRGRLNWAQCRIYDMTTPRNCTVCMSHPESEKLVGLCPFPSLNSLC